MRMGEEETFAPKPWLSASKQPQDSSIRSLEHVEDIRSMSNECFPDSELPDWLSVMGCSS